VGPCRPGAGFDRVENALRGEWTLPCERGALRVSITLAPTEPPGGAAPRGDGGGRGERGRAAPATCAVEPRGAGR
jgi:hypothetical protein